MKEIKKTKTHTTKEPSLHWDYWSSSNEKIIDWQEIQWEDKVLKTERSWEKRIKTSIELGLWNKKKIKLTKFKIKKIKYLEYTT